MQLQLSGIKSLRMLSCFWRCGFIVDWQLLDTSLRSWKLPPLQQASCAAAHVLSCLLLACRNCKHWRRASVSVHVKLYMKTQQAQKLHWIKQDSDCGWQVGVRMLLKCSIGSRRYRSPGRLPVPIRCDMIACITQRHLSALATCR